MHRAQTRKYNHKPYRVHPRRVYFRLMLAIDESPADTETLGCVAYLHDVVEDSKESAIPFTFEMVECLFGAPIRQIVEELTNQEPKSLPRETRKNMMCARLKAASRFAKMVKLADRTDNLLDLAGAPRSFMETYYLESQDLLPNLMGTGCKALEDAYSAASNRVWLLAKEAK